MKKAQLTKLALAFSLGLGMLVSQSAQALDTHMAPGSTNVMDCRTGLCYNSLGIMGWFYPIRWF